MIAIEIADRKNWRFLWLETDSQLVVLALKMLEWFLGTLGIDGLTV